MRRGFAVAVSATLLASAAFSAETRRVLLVTDGNEPVRQREILRLQKSLTDSGLLEARLTEDPAGISAGLLSGYAAVVLDATARKPEDAERALKRFVDSGKGLVVLRGLACTPCGEAVAPRQEPGPARPVRVKWTNRAHPIASGSPEQFLTLDQLGPIPKLPSGATVLASSVDGGHPLIWTLSRGKGRILQTVLGENPALFEEPEFLKTLMRGIEWVASGTVAASPQRSRPVRTLIVTGGHDHDATFYDIFEGQTDIAANVDPHPFPYRRGDLRKRYDVLVLYDSMQEITDRERQVLTDFVESGKGVVVVHHALVDYCNWPWWYQDVVGGRWYQTEDKPPRWKTTWKHGVEMIVEPVGQHPVLDGVGPLHIVDETYKGMWLSPDNTVLLKTAEPSSDGPVAWISPYRKSRVVVIELGHDRMAHLHPAYRRLLRNSVLWSGGAK